MAKYIDAEKLIAKIKSVRQDWLGNSTGLEVGESAAELGAAECILDSIDDIIDSLQEDQPIDKNTLTWKDINDLERIINNVHYEFRNGIGEKSFGEEVLERFREERDEQEQPEVDLEKEMKEYFKGWTETEEGIACHYQYVDLNTCHGIARHFYELGRNARKEE